MELLGAIFGLALAAFLLFWVFVGGAILLAFLYVLWPTAVGLILCVILWRAGHDNFGVAVLLILLIIQFFWSQRLPKGTGGGSYNPMSGKGKIYDKSGNVRGFYDKSD
jgi:hypothetical protein